MKYVEHFALFKYCKFCIAHIAFGDQINVKRRLKEIGSVVSHLQPLDSSTVISQHLLRQEVLRYIEW